MSTLNPLFLHCWVIGETKSFHVKIPGEKTISELKEAIQAKDFQNFPAKFLTLYKATVVNDDNINERLQNLDVTKLTRLRPSHTVLQSFQDHPPQGSIVVVVIQPPGECQWMCVQAAVTNNLQWLSQCCLSSMLRCPALFRVLRFVHSLRRTALTFPDVLSLIPSLDLTRGECKWLTAQTLLICYSFLLPVKRQLSPDLDPDPRRGKHPRIEADTNVAPSVPPTAPKPSFEQSYLSSLLNPSFRVLRQNLGRFFVDKTALIEHVVNRGFGHVDLVLRPRRCGKSTMLDMLR